MSDDVNVKFGASTGDAEKGISTIEQRLQSLSEVATKAFEANQIIEFGEKLQELGERVIEFAEHYAEMGEEVNRATQILGVSAREFQEFQYAIKLTGGNADGAVQSLTRLQKNIGDAARGAGEAAPFFRSVGVSMDDLKNGNFDQILGKIAQSFSQTADGIEKTTIATAIGGRGFAQMIPTLNQGEAGLKKLREEFEKTGLAMTGEQAAKLEETGDKIEVLGDAFEGVGLTIFEYIQPAIDLFVDGLTDLVSGFNKSISAGGEWQDLFSAVTLIINAAVDALDKFITGIRVMWNITVLAITEMEVGWTTLANIMMDVLTGNWSKIDDDYRAGLAKIEQATNETIDRIDKRLTDQAKRSKEMWSDWAKGAMDNGENKEDKKDTRPKPKLPQDAGKAKEAAQERIAIATDEITTQQKLRMLDLANQQDALDSSVRMGLLSEEQKFQYMQQFANEEYQIRKDAIDKELQLEGLKESQIKRLKDERLILERQHQNDLAQIQRQSQEQEQSRYKQVFSTISSSFKGMIQGILQGTQTWQQALANMFTNILASFAGMLADMALRWIEMQIMTAIFGKTTSVGIISGHAAEGAAGAYAATAAIPYVGPALAPGAAALAYGNIMAFNALPSYDVGAWEIGKSGVAMVHEGETIMPAKTAQSWRDGAEGTGNNPATGDIHLHLHAIDGKSAKQFLNDNKAAIAAALRSAQRDGNANMSAMMKS